VMRPRSSSSGAIQVPQLQLQLHGNFLSKQEVYINSLNSEFSDCNTVIALCLLTVSRYVSNVT